jgi:hypothetical protein
VSGRVDYELLRATRRIDWRFLLPDPDLGRTAYFGRPDEALLDALVRCAPELMSFAGASDGCAERRDHSPFDLVVLVDPAPADVIGAARLLRPDGWLYAEQTRSVPARVRAAAFSRRELRTWEALGLVDVQAHWHWPDFASCEEIVPLDDADVIRHMLERRLVYGQRLKVALARLLLRGRLFAVAVENVSVLGRRNRRSGDGI